MNRSGGKNGRVSLGDAVHRVWSSMMDIRLVAAAVAVALVGCRPPGPTCADRCQFKYNACAACCSPLQGPTLTRCLDNCGCQRECCLDDCGQGVPGRCSECRSLYAFLGCDPEKTRDRDGDGFSFYDGDCDDTNPDINPAALESPNGIDDDCDGITDEDRDGDGYSELEGDCDDADPAVNPSVPETCSDGVDNNCNGYTDEDEPDRDIDGFGPCAGDCNDDDPEIGPNSVEVPGDSVDNDCDGLTDEARQGCDCLGSAQGPAQMLEALELCDSNVAVNVWPRGEEVQFGVLENFGAIVPRTSETYPEVEGLLDDNCKMVIMCTGEVGTATPQPGSDLGNTDPDPMAPDEQAHDLARLYIVVRVPLNVRGFSFDFMFLSAEYPEFVCTRYEDTFYAIKQEPSLNNGEPVSVSFYGSGHKISVNGGFFELPDYWTQSLVGTGYDVPDPDVSCLGDPMVYPGCNMPDPCPPPNNTIGSSTGWLRTTSPITPGDTVTLTFSIHDENDHILDSCVVIDNFQWLTTPVDEPFTEK